MSEHLKNISFTDDLKDSNFVKPLRFHFERKNLKMIWDLAFETDSVFVILFNKTVGKLLFVRQFRPAVFLRNVLRLPENKGKTYDQVDFSKYDINQHGLTLELCAGIIDKPISTKKVAKEEILEECGYDIPLDEIQYVRTFVGYTFCSSGVSTSGAENHLFFAVIDDSQKVNQGGGNQHEGEFIETVYLSIDEVQSLVDEGQNCPPSLLFGLLWFLSNKERLLKDI